MDRHRNFGSVEMQATLLWYTRRVPIANSQRGGWMNALKNLMLRAGAVREISRRGMAIAAILTVLAATAITASAQAPAPKRTVIRAGRVLNVRTGELRANQAIVIEGNKIAKIAPSTQVPAPPRYPTLH